MQAKQLNVPVELIKFISVGGLAAIFNFFSRLLLSMVVNYTTAVITAYLIGMITAFILCRLVVFQPQPHTNLRQVMYFILVNLVAVGQTLVISLLLVNALVPYINELAQREAIAHFVGICLPVFTSYLGHKYFTFE